MNRLAKVVLLAGVFCLMVGPVWADTGGKPDSKLDSYSRGLLDCSNAITLQCNTSVAGDNTNSINNVELYSCVSWNEAGGEDVYVLELDDLYTLNIVISDMTADLDVFLLVDCDEALCTAYGNTTITGDFGPGTYYVVVDGYNGAVSPYTLSVDCEIPPPPPEEDGSVCDFVSLCCVMDFTQSPCMMTPAICDAAGGTPVWQWGPESLVPGAPANVWGTVLNGDYPASAGEGLLTMPFEVTPLCCWMEVKHYVYTEGYTTGSGNIYDGCNVTVDDVVIPPVEGYTGVAGSAPYCVAGEEVFAGNVTDNVPIRTWGRSCFDLTQFMGQTIQVRFDFGSDSSVQRPGWYLEYVKFGTTEAPVPIETENWGNLKAIYR